MHRGSIVSVQHQLSNAMVISVMPHPSPAEMLAFWRELVDADSAAHASACCDAGVKTVASEGVVASVAGLSTE